jgi:hypothetical protein
MDAKIAFFAVAAIAFVSIIGLYFVDNTGAWSWNNPQPRDGYCRCITGPYEIGAYPDYYGGKGLEFKGFMTFGNCVKTCGSKYSWIPK